MGLAWLMLACASLGVARALIVPPGQYNIDEAQHWRAILEVTDALRDVLAGRGGSAGLELLIRGDGPALKSGQVYYLFVAGSQLLLPANTDGWGRLVAARLAGVALNLAVVWLAYGTLWNLLRGRAVASLAGASLAALIPSFGDMMSGVNLDVAVAAIGSLVTYALLLIVRRGISPGRLLALVLGLTLGYALKGTILPLFVVTAIVGLVTCVRLLRTTADELLILASFLVLIGHVLIGWIATPLPSLTWERTGNWFFDRWSLGNDIWLAPRIETDSPAGGYAIRLPGSDVPNESGVLQYVPESRVGQLRGRVITWGTWMRAPNGASVTPPAVGERREENALGLNVNGDWEFYASTGAVPLSARHLALFLSAPSEGTEVWYDGLVVAAGEFPTSVPPVFSNEQALSGLWGGAAFTNLLSNPSAERSWPQAPKDYGSSYNLNNRIYAVLAWRRTAPAWSGLIRWLLANFWSSFGGLLPGLSSAQMVPLALISAVSAAGVGAVILRDIPRHIPPFDSTGSRLGFLMLLGVVIGVGLLVLYRADLVPNQAEMIIWSSARHASAGRIAIAALIAIGFRRWFPRRAHRWLLAFSVLALFVLNVYILLWVQIPVYRCPSSLITDCLPTVH